MHHDRAVYDLIILQTSVDELYNLTEEDYTDYFDLMPKKLELTNIDTNSDIGFSDVSKNDSEELP